MNNLNMTWEGVHNRFLDLLEPLKGCQQSAPHMFDAYDHSAVVFEATRLMVNGLPDEEPFNIDSFSLLIAAALHDTGKPSTRMVRAGKISFHRHEHVGASLNEPYLESRALDPMEINRINRLVKMHLRPAFLYRERLENPDRPSEKAIRSLNYDAVGLRNELCILAIADMYGKQGKNGPPEELEGYVAFLAEIMGCIVWRASIGIDALIEMRK